MKIELTPCYIITGWATEIKEGIGYRIKQLHESCWHGDKTIVVINGEWSIHNSSTVLFDKAEAVRQLNKEKQNYIDYLTKTIEESKNTIKNIKP